MLAGGLSKIKELSDKVTNMVMNYTETEAKVRDATNEDPWGPTNQQMQEIAQLMNSAEKFDEVMGMIWKRLIEDGMIATESGWQQNNSGMLGGIVSSNPANMYRRTYKSLLLINHLLLAGPERSVDAIRDRSYQLRRLADSYKYVDENGRDQGLNVRHRAKEIIELLADDNRIRDERRKTRSSKSKYVGVSSDSLAFSRHSASGSGEYRSYSDENEIGNGGSSTGSKRASKPSQGNGNGSSLPPRLPDFDSWEEGRERNFMDTIVDSVLDAVSMPQRPPLEETRADNSAGIPEDNDPEDAGSGSRSGFRDRDRSSAAYRDDRSAGYRDDRSDTASSKSPHAHKSASKQSSGVGGGDTPSKRDRSPSNASTGSRSSNKPVISLLPPSASKQTAASTPASVNLLDLDDAPAPAPALATPNSNTVSFSKLPAAHVAAATPVGAGAGAGEEDFADFQSAFGGKGGSAAASATAAKQQATPVANFADFASFSSASASASAPNPSIPVPAAPAQAQSKAPIIPLSAIPLAPQAASSRSAAAPPALPPQPPTQLSPTAAAPFSAQLSTSASNVLDSPNANASGAAGFGLLMPKQTASGLAVSIGANKTLPAGSASTLGSAPSPVSSQQQTGGKVSMNAMIAGRSTPQQSQTPGSTSWTPNFPSATSASGSSGEQSAAVAPGTRAPAGDSAAAPGGKVGSTWADFKGVDISVDRLTAIDRFKKPGASLAQPMSPTKTAPANR